MKASTVSSQLAGPPTPTRTAQVVGRGKARVDLVLEGSRARLNGVPVAGAMPRVGDVVDVELRRGQYIALGTPGATGESTDLSIINAAGSGGALVYAPLAHPLDGSNHLGTLGDAQAPQFLKLDGTRVATGRMQFEGGFTLQTQQWIEFGTSRDANIDTSSGTLRLLPKAGYVQTGGLGLSARSAVMDGITALAIQADSVVAYGLTAQKEVIVGPGINSVDGVWALRYGSLRLDEDAFWLDTHAPFVASWKPMVIHSGDYSGTKYVSIDETVDGGESYWIIQSTRNLSLGAAGTSSAGNQIVFFGDQGAGTWLNLQGSAGDGPVWKSSNYAHWWGDSDQSELFGLDLSSTSRALLKSNRNRIRLGGSVGSYFEVNLTGSVGDGPRLDSSGYKFTFYDSGGTRSFQFDMSNSAGPALLSWTNKLYLTNASGASLAINLTGSAADGPRLDSSGYKFTFYDSAGTRSFQFDMADSAGLAMTTWTGRFYWNGDGGRSLVYYGDGAYSENKLVLTDYTGSGRLWSVDTTNASFSTITSHGGFKHVVGSDYMTFSPNAAGVQFDLNASSRIFYFNGILNCGEEYRVDNSRVVANRKTGWSTWTGTAARGAYNADDAITGAASYDKDQITWLSDRLVEVRRALKALVDDLHATAGHGLIGT